ncbi:kazal-type serine protease inhibitor domain-containing protein 1-like [Xyrauchen texanus]|uniref:kazal-type serine protease inhibitor domain-containing protein 1-like n=1 Tax=Xyrauchen texanus TaxID=154827 RepID=UPI002241D9ED|nr:kazal-type serine protease inhibitor domain-containing protein 1-like [Xyrauchen texanus]
MFMHMGICAVLVFSVRPGDFFPNFKYDYMDEDLATFDYYKGTDEFDERNRTEECDECAPELCPLTQGCRAGLVKDRCGCCSECANLEGQTCDLGQRSVYYGLCGDGLECKVDRSDGVEEEEKDPQCVCASQKALCGSDGETYRNLCKFKEEAFLKPGLNVSDGPCKTVPIIKVPPHNLVNVTGSSIAFLCEVFAFPMALVEWRKDGKEVILPGDDPHISVQSRGGPQKYELSSWLQIEEASQMDSGTYRCIARNELGHVSATAILGVLPPDEMVAYLEQNMNAMMSYEQLQDYDSDYY